MLIQKKTKIVATIGPSSDNEETMALMFDAGMNVIRLNFSHGDFETHQKGLDVAKKLARKMNRPLGVIQDLGGPKIRIGNFVDGHISLIENETFILTTQLILGDEKKVYVNYPHLPKEVKVGDSILLDDGKKRLEVTAILGNEVITKVVVGGDIKDKRGVNLPGSDLSISALTKKDKNDLKFGLENNVDFVALSFVKTAKDVLELRKILNDNKSEIGILAKIETRQAVENIDKIIELSDGIMIARGDLSIEVATEKVPTIQKDIIRKCNQLGKPVITATQMLDSMILSPVPTRAEVSDVANAILDGTDAVMLSEETALGKYPIETVRVMTKIAIQIEMDSPAREIVRNFDNGVVDAVDSLTSAIVRSSREVDAKLIFALTDKGFTARMVSRHKPSVPVIAFTPNASTYNKLSASFGCFPVRTKNFATLKETLKFIQKFSIDNKLAKKGDKIILGTGVPFHNASIRTNTMIVYVI